MPHQEIIMIKGLNPDGGTGGGEVVYTVTPQEMADTSETITAKYLRKSLQ